MARSYRDTLAVAGLPSFLWTQFLGAFNDNLFKMVVSLVAVHAVSQVESGRALSLVGAIFIVPFLLFSGYAGQIADIRSKRTVLVATKSLEIVAASLGLIAFLLGRLELAYVVLFLIAVQATFFSPAKYGILPEILAEGDLSRANGVLEMSTFVAIVVGTAGGSFMFDVWRGHLWLVGLVVVAVAVVGTAASFRIPHVQPALPGQRLSLNPWSEIGAGLKRLRGDRVMRLTVIGLSYFWFMGALLQLVVILFGTEVLLLSDRWVGVLTTCSAIGIAAGSMAAGRLSGDKVELGLAPIGSIGMGLFAMLLARSGHSFALSAFSLATLGFFGGLFAVPLNALLQQRSGAEEKGRLMATNNFLNMVGILLASAALWLCKSALRMPADRIILVFGVITLLASVYVLAVVPAFLIRFALWIATHTMYRILIVGPEHVPSRGPALLVCNHMSHVDGLLVGSCVQRFIRFLVYRPYYEHRLFHWLLALMKAIPVAAGRDALQSLERARQELQDGHVVCIFAEGSISRTGNLLPLKRGFERIVKDLDVPVIPVYLDRVWGSIFSFKGGRFFWKRPLRIPYPVTVAFGRPMPSSTTADEARLALLELGAEVAGSRRPSHEALGRQFVRTAKSRWRSFCMADSTGQRLTYGRTLVAGQLLARWIRRHAPHESMIGLLLPASVGGALANLGVTLAGKTAVNLNFTAGRESLSYAVDKCQIRTILTSRTFLEKIGFEPIEGMFFVEDLLRATGRTARIAQFLVSLLAPAPLLNAWFARNAQAEQLATVVFSSGSTGIPKGVMLTHRNVLANVDAINQVYELTSEDVMLGVLPFFHSFGFTGTLWLPLLAGFGVVYHPNPMDAKKVGELAERYGATLLISTPTFCSTYVRKCRPEQFSRIRYALVGAEKLRESMAQAFKERFGLDLLEGYGCTEMSPVVAVNAPNVTHGREHQTGVKRGSVGHPLPGVAAKVVDPATGDGPLFEREGLLLVKGPNLMTGYLGEPDKTSAALSNGWYVTGDVARIDDSGFVYITDRLSRFSKIGGEMVPHLKIEDCINAAIAEGCTSVVTSVSDPDRGERLVALFTDPQLTPQALWERLCRTELPRLWLPKREDLHQVESIPLLGTGKVDLRKARQLATELSATAACALPTA